MTPAHRLPALLSFGTALSLLSFGTADAAPLRLAPAAPGDLVASAAVASDAPSLAPAGGPASFTWPIDQASDDLLARPAAHTATSTGHAGTASAAELRRGLPIPISSAGAFFKLSGEVSDIVLVDPKGREHRAGAGLELVGSASGHAYTLATDLGVGTFVLRATASGDVRVDVLERGSDVVLLARTDRDVVFRGDEVQVQVRLLHRGVPVTADRVTARLLGLDGKALTRVLTRKSDGSYRASLPASGPASATPYTIELQADATVAGRAVRRSTTTAVAISVPTARLTGAADLRTGPDGLRAELELDVASDGRYAATAVLYGRNREGQLQPVAVGQSADQLAPGRRSLVLGFDARTLEDSGMRGPFELHDLRLVDQGRMHVLHRQARALAPR